MMTQADFQEYVNWMLHLIEVEPHEAARRCMREQLAQAERHWAETHRTSVE